MWNNEDFCHYANSMNKMALSGFSSSDLLVLYAIKSKNFNQSHHTPIITLISDNHCLFFFSAEKYCALVISEDGVPLLQDLVNSPNVPARVQEYSRIVLTKCQPFLNNEQVTEMTFTKDC